MSSDPDIIRIEARLEEAQDAERRDHARVMQLTEVLVTAKAAQSVAKDADQTAQLEKKLEGGAWREAASKKCDYWKDAPADLVAAVRKEKGGVKGNTHHFTAAADGPTLFRFGRSKT